MRKSLFKGSISVRSTPHGYAVRFEAQTDAHDLGHALAAIITSYLDKYKKHNPGGDDVNELRGIVLKGIERGLEHNPAPLQHH